MLRATVKFCGGCNPRYERKEAYLQIIDSLQEITHFELPQNNTTYDVLLIIRGCTGCPYLYEQEIQAKHRIICADVQEVPQVISQMRSIHQKEDINQ